jgi:hypothetical protein
MEIIDEYLNNNEPFEQLKYISLRGNQLVDDDIRYSSMISILDIITNI